MRSFGLVFLLVPLLLVVHTRGHEEHATSDSDAALKRVEEIVLQVESGALATQSLSKRLEQHATMLNDQKVAMEGLRKTMGEQQKLAAAGTPAVSLADFETLKKALDAMRKDVTGALEKLKKESAGYRKTIDEVKADSKRALDLFETLAAQQRELNEKVKESADWSTWASSRFRTAMANAKAFSASVQDHTKAAYQSTRAFYDETLRPHVGQAIDQATATWEMTKPHLAQAAKTTKMWAGQVHEEYRPVLEKQVDVLRQWAAKSLPTQTKQFHSLITVEAVAVLLTLLSAILLRLFCSCFCCRKRGSKVPEMANQKGNNAKRKQNKA